MNKITSGDYDAAQLEAVRALDEEVVFIASRGRVLERKTGMLMNRRAFTRFAYANRRYRDARGGDASAAEAWLKWPDRSSVDDACHVPGRTGLVQLDDGRRVWSTSHPSAVGVRLAEEIAEVETFPITIKLPPMSTFRSRWRRSPFLLLEDWVAEQVSDRAVLVNDYIVHRDDMSELLKEVREWMRQVHGRTGKQLAQAVAFHDVDCGPLETRNRKMPRGYAYVKRPENRARARRA